MEKREQPSWWPWLKRLGSRRLITSSFTWLLVLLTFLTSAQAVQAECFFKILNSGAQFTVDSDLDDAFYSNQDALDRLTDGGVLQPVNFRVILGVSGSQSAEREYVAEVRSLLHDQVIDVQGLYNYGDPSILDSGTIFQTPTAQESTQQITFTLQPNQRTDISILDEDGWPLCTLVIHPPAVNDECQFSQHCLGNIFDNNDVLLQADVVGTQVCNGHITGNGNGGLICSAQGWMGDTTFEDCTACNYCGNGQCNPGEGEHYCPQDCPDGPNTVVVCGNGICEATENHDNCPDDCVLTNAACVWDPIDDSGENYFFAAVVPQPFEEGALQATFYCANPGSLSDQLSSIISDAGLPCGGILGQLANMIARPIIPLPATAPAPSGRFGSFGTYYSGLQLSGLDKEQIFEVVRANAAKNCAGDSVKEAVATALGAMTVARAPVRGSTFVGGSAVIRFGSAAIADALKTGQILAQDASVEEQSAMMQEIEGCANEVLNNIPHYRGVVMDNGRRICEADLVINISFDLSDITTEPYVEEEITRHAFDYCKQIPKDDGQRDQCIACIEKGDEGQYIFTAVGCIRVQGKGLAEDLIRLMMGIAGGVAFLSILAAAFHLTISRGDTSHVKEAKELVTAAVTGLLFLIFSIIILQFIGVEVLQLPSLS